ncbi:DUF4173 domain-containing protein [Streptomyces tateyamensis]|uniref:DUF4173 domain-containing protein n=1 Tax=Streptomyces tateyamensis TaxID=565073 RepID=A0A2V4NZV2_9ACTN|nr:DUF4173 domain-containing protein [Streptomyces tateyamensis]
MPGQVPPSVWDAPLNGYRPPLHPVKPPQPGWVVAIRARPAPAPGPRVLLAALVVGLLSAVLLNGAVAANLLLVAVAAAVPAALSARAAGRRVRPWTALWALGALALLAVPLLSDAGWPSLLAVTAALALASLGLHGGRTWAGVLLGGIGTCWQVLPSLPAAAAAVRSVAMPDRARWLPAVRAVLATAILLAVFGSLFAAADPAFGDLFAGLSPQLPFGWDLIGRVLVFLGGTAVALGAARTAAAPVRYDRLPVRPATPRRLLEWAVPLAVLDLLFATFIGLQLAVLFGGYRRLIKETGLTYAEYARQGFWQLLWVTLLTLVVVAVAHRWAPRATGRDRAAVRVLLGLLCALSLGVVGAGLLRMRHYVDAYGLTQLRVWVTGVELWLALLFVLLLVAVLTRRTGWLPRAVAASAALAALVYGLVSPDALVAQQNVDRYRASGRIDLAYLRTLSADAVPALDQLPEAERNCALHRISERVGESVPWYATSLSTAEARRILAARPLTDDLTGCPADDEPGDAAP